MNKHFSYIIFTLLAIIALPLQCSAEDVERPPAFEKLYVTPHEILSTPEGTYYLSPTGESLKVALSQEMATVNISF